MDDPFNPAQAIKGRGAASNPEGRFETLRHHAEDDGWQNALLDEAAPRPRTEITEERTRSVITRNDSPDVGFDQALNPYRGCEHGCIYYDPDFRTRMHGSGVLAQLLHQRFEITCRKHGLSRAREPALDCTRFMPPREASPQGELF